MKVLDLIRKKQLYAEVAKSMARMNFRSMKL